MTEKDRSPGKPDAKPVSASHISIAQLMQPEHANILGNVHGGWIMKLVDEAGALACMRHAQQRVVTVAVDQLIFREPIRIGDLVTTTGKYRVTFFLKKNGSTMQIRQITIESEDF